MKALTVGISVSQVVVEVCDVVFSVIGIEAAVDDVDI